MAKSLLFHIGTSGWMYDHWRGIFYPDGISQSEMLSFYAKSFDTVEVNNTFYQLPKAKSVQQWEDKVPRNFLFVIKANRYITHMKNLKEVKKPLKNLLDTVGLLKKRLGPVIFQLPPNWQVNTKRLEDFLDILPKRQKYVFEFRHPSWYRKRIFDALKKNNVALCIHDHAQGKSPEKLTTGFIYIRLHGPHGAYSNKYSKSQIKKWAEKIKKWQKKGIEVFCYFNNDARAFAIENAKELKNLLNIK